jgi:hypothetical protein
MSGSYVGTVAQAGLVDLVLSEETAFESTSVALDVVLIRPCR